MAPAGSAPLLRLRFRDNNLLSRTAERLRHFTKQQTSAVITSPCITPSLQFQHGNQKNEKLTGYVLKM